MRSTLQSLFQKETLQKNPFLTHVYLVANVAQGFLDVQLADVPSRSKHRGQRSV